MRQETIFFCVFPVLYSLEKVGKEAVGTRNKPGLENNNDIVAKLTA